MRREHVVDRAREVGERVRDAGAAQVDVVVALRARRRARRGTSRCSPARSVENSRTPAAGSRRARDRGTPRTDGRHRDRLDRPGCRTLPTSTGTRRRRSPRTRRRWSAARPDRDRHLAPVEHRSSVGAYPSSAGPDSQYRTDAPVRLRERVREAHAAGHVLALDRSRRLEARRGRRQRSRTRPRVAARSPGAASRSK